MRDPCQGNVHKNILIIQKVERVCQNVDVALAKYAKIGEGLGAALAGNLTLSEQLLDE